MSILEILVTIFSGVLESLFASYLITVIVELLNKFNNTTHNIRSFVKFWLIILVSVIINRTIHTYFPDFEWLKSIVFIALSSFACLVCFKTKLYKGVITAILFLIISAILEIITVLILKAFDISTTSILSNSYYYNAYACCLAIFNAFIGFIVTKTIILVNKNLANVDNKLKYFMPQLVAIIICLFPSMILLVLNYYQYSALFLFINFIQLFVVAFVGIYNLKFVVKHENTELKLANTITYNETLKKVNEGVRGFKHDMGNIVQAILGYIAINDSEGAKNYCQNLVIGFNDINVLSILSPKVIDDPAIYGVVVNKILVARDKNMTLSLDINLNVSEINFPKFELSRILGILIDNAIEAGEQTEDKKLIVNMYHDYDRNTDVIIISNSIKDTNIDTEKIFEKNYSTKENPSGFGLYEVTKFIKQNPQAYIVTSVDKGDQLFTQTLIISSNIVNSQNTLNDKSTVA